LKGCVDTGGREGREPGEGARGGGGEGGSQEESQLTTRELNSVKSRGVQKRKFSRAAWQVARRKGRGIKYFRPLRANRECDAIDFERRSGEK